MTRFGDWEDVVAFALSLPETAMASFYGQPAPKVNGKAFVSQGREPGSFHVPSPHEEKAVLLATDPESFWQTAHYEGWPGLLVRYGSVDPERVALVHHSGLVGQGFEDAEEGVRGPALTRPRPARLSGPAPE
jgi:hypothetical protein